METLNIWDRFSKHYDIGVASTTMYHEIQHKVVNALKNCQVIADIGCGTGNLTLALLKQGKEVYSCDNSQGMLTTAKKKISKKQFKD